MGYELTKKSQLFIVRDYHPGTVTYVTIGRNTDSDYYVENSLISRKHSVFCYDLYGGWSIKDGGKSFSESSTHGTWINLSYKYYDMKLSL